MPQPNTFWVSAAQPLSQASGSSPVVPSRVSRVASSSNPPSSSILSGVRLWMRRSSQVMLTGAGSRSGARRGELDFDWAMVHAVALLHLVWGNRLYFT